MELYLTRQHNGLYMLTKNKPIFAMVGDRGFEDAYVAPGEPIGMRNFCDLILPLVGLTKPLIRGECIKIELNGKILEQ
jgi:hypothetical protein